jgi:ATP-dependent Zn protease
MLIAQTTQTTINVADFLLPLLPWILVFLFVWFIVFRTLRGQNSHMSRAQEHWRNVEAKLDRLIEIAERHDKGG